MCVVCEIFANLRLFTPETLHKMELTRKTRNQSVFVDTRSLLLHRLFTVLYFSVRWSKSRALSYGLPSCMSVKTTYGAGAVWEEARKIGSDFSRPPPPTAIIPDARPPRYI